MQLQLYMAGFVLLHVVITDFSVMVAIPRLKLVTVEATQVLQMPVEPVVHVVLLAVAVELQPSGSDQQSVDGEIIPGLLGKVVTAHAP